MMLYVIFLFIKNEKKNQIQKEKKIEKKQLNLKPFQNNINKLIYVIIKKHPYQENIISR